MAALSVCFSISTRHRLVAWMRMCGNVQLGASLSSFFFLSSCFVPTFDSGGFRMETLNLSWLSCSQTLWKRWQLPNQRDGWKSGLFLFFSSPFSFLFFPFLPEAKKKRKKKRFEMWMFLLERFFCCLWGCGSVLIVYSAVPVCSLSVCICTLKFWAEKK